MKVLYFASRLPINTLKGDQLIAYNQLKELQKKTELEIHLISLYNNEKDLIKAERILPALCYKHYLFKQNKIDNLLGMMKFFTNFKPLQVNYYHTSRIQKKINGLIRKINPDIIHVQLIRNAEYFIDSNIPKSIDFIDLMSLNMARRAKKEGMLKQLIFNFESKLLKKYEKTVLSKYDQTILVSEEDRKYLEKNKRIFIIPNGTYITPELISQYSEVKKENSLVFHGGMDYFPNVEAMKKFTSKIWPQIHKRIPDLHLKIVGNRPVPAIQKLDGKNGIIVTGFVEDMVLELCKSLIGIYPMNSGTGMQNKILEALACGLPVIANDVALQGLENYTEEDLIVSNTEEDIIDAISDLYGNETKRAAFGKNAKEYIAKKYSWEKNAQELYKTWEGTLRRKNK